MSLFTIWLLFTYIFLSMFAASHQAVFPHLFSLLITSPSFFLFFYMGRFLFCDFQLRAHFCTQCLCLIHTVLTQIRVPWGNGTQDLPCGLQVCYLQYSSSQPQSIQIARLFLQLAELGPPHSLTRKRVLLLPLLGPMGETDSLAREGVGEPKFEEGTVILVLYDN